MKKIFKELKRKVEERINKWQEKRELLKGLKISRDNIVRFNIYIAEYKIELERLNGTDKERERLLNCWIEKYERMINRANLDVKYATTKLAELEKN